MIFLQNTYQSSGDSNYVPASWEGFYDPNANYNYGPKRVNGLEIITIFLCLAVLAGTFLYSFFNQYTLNRDKQRESHIRQIISALSEFYNNSSTIPLQRAYPIRICSNDLNEVDFEYTLRRHLTGKVVERDNHPYIAEDKYIKDPWGEYSQRVNQRKIPLRTCPVFSGLDSTQNNSLIYLDGYPSCNFNQARNYKKCYIYTSSNNGDTYEVGYYQETTGQFIRYRKFREG